MSEARPYRISKWEVWKAYEKDKANKGAAGVDEQSIQGFERKLKDNRQTELLLFDRGSCLRNAARKQVCLDGNLLTSQ